MAEKNYYEILGVPKNATQDDIKKAFRKLSMQYHPDRFVGKPEKEQKEAEDKFKEINEAYTTLSDPDKRAKYDNPEPKGFFNPFRGFNPFAGFNPFNTKTTETPYQQVNIGSDLFIGVTVTLKEAYEGARKTIRFHRNVHCPDCNGTGSADGKEKTCPHCNGTGFVKEETVIGNTHFQKIRPCGHCGGKGKVVENPCKTCDGTGLKSVLVTETIDIPKGVFNGLQLRIERMGNEPSGNGINGNLILTINVINDPYYTLSKNSFDVTHIEYVNFNEALLGCEKEIKFLNGKTKKLKIKECTPDGFVTKYDGMGMYNINADNGQYGDYYVIIKYNYPKSLNKEQKKLLEDFKW